MTYLQSPNLITRTILKKAIDVTNEKYEKNQLYKSKEDIIVLIQALARGFLVRKAVKQRMDYFMSNLDQIVKIQVSFKLNKTLFDEIIFIYSMCFSQSWWRMIRQKTVFKNRLKYIESNVDSAIIIQSFVKMWLTRKRYLKRKNFYPKNVINADIKFNYGIKLKT